MVSKIKAQMNEVTYIDKLGRKFKYGEYFPAEICPWTYNETNAQDFFPLNKEKAEAEGYSWRDPDLREYAAATATVPEHIKDVDDSILKEILKCVSCGKNYRLIPAEIELYKRFKIPVPNKCSLCRDFERIDRLTPIKIYDRKCDKCGKDIQTSYDPEGPETVFCEACYRAEVV
jgi:hypothetical protein